MVKSGERGTMEAGDRAGVARAVTEVQPVEVSPADCLSYRRMVT